MTSMTTSPEASTAKPVGKWDKLGYRPVDGLANRYISRYLRTQRKTMRRFFAERGFTEYFLRLEAIRKNSRMGMLQRQQAFKRILDDYAAHVLAANTPVAAPEAAATVQPGILDLSSSGAPVAVSNEDRFEDDGGRVHAVAPSDDAESVIKE